uniref:transposase n=1 Tax=Candidatus Enterovibrio escicola TaxID=1927127 RepID=UPI0013140ABD|nr:transposase [Candidatus Enterovibrio escacola]
MFASASPTRISQLHANAQSHARCSGFDLSYLTHSQARPTGISFVDSSTLQVCHNLRIFRHQVFKGTAKRGKEQ